MPPNLDIERKLPLEGTVPAYNEHVVISTAKSDWSSRIEEDESGALAHELKSLLGPKGKYFNPYRNILLTASSFKSQAADESPQRPSSSAHKQDSPDNASATTEHDSQSTSVCMFPSFIEYPYVDINAQGAEDLVTHLTEGSEQQLAQGRPIEDIIVLICSHGTRDSRCGILGPILQDEFVDQLANAGIASSLHSDQTGSHSDTTVRLGSISHIGGHRWAGNVILYFPPSLKQHPLAGHGIWYGRVKPEHVEGIVQATIRDGTIIHELFRGGITPDRKPLRLASSTT